MRNSSGESLTKSISSMSTQPCSEIKEPTILYQLNTIEQLLEETGNLLNILNNIMFFMIKNRVH